MSKRTGQSESGTSTVVELPRNFIGKADEARLESFGAYLVKHGAASRWCWNRSEGFDVAFEVYWGDEEPRLLLTIARDHGSEAFYMTDSSGSRVHTGSLERVMAIADIAARALTGDTPA